jgi:hypothetical protein
MGACGVCGKHAGKTCSGCGTVKYCSKECQSADWKAHKPFCGCNECGRKATKSCNCGGKLCDACPGCEAQPASRDPMCPICLDPLTNKVTFMCGHDVCDTCYIGLANSGTNPNCGVCRRRSMVNNAEPEETIDKALLASAQFELYTIIGDDQLKLIRAWTFLTDTAACTGVISADEELILIANAVRKLKECTRLATLLKTALAFEDIRAHGRYNAYSPHRWIRLGIELYASAPAAYGAYTRRFCMPGPFFARYPHGACAQI